MTSIDFVGRKFIWFSFSALVIAVGLVAIITQGLSFGIEFKGGSLFEVKFAKATSTADVRGALEVIGFGDAVIQQGGSAKTIFVRTEELGADREDDVRVALKKLGAKDFIIQEVGASWGRRLTEGTLIALVVAIAVVLVFVALRFDVKMGVAAVVALSHDVLIAVGLYALVGRPVTTATVAAFLTVMGYSIYDTIVIFDRVRENSGSYKSKKTYSDVVNTSVNQSLRRSINTSMTSIIPVASLLIIGGETLKDFAFALLVGLASGAYSSIFIASPFLAMWKEREPKFAAIRRKLES